MKIQLFGNCSILLSTENSRILFDPYFSNMGNPAFKRVYEVSPLYKNISHLDGILLSHEHFDHMDMGFLSNFKNKCPIYAPKWSIKPGIFKSKRIWRGDEFTTGDFSVTVVQANHLVPTVGYIIKAEGLTLYFAGDTYYGSFMKDLSQKYKIDIAMLPLTNYRPPMTMGENGVIHCLKDLTPKYFIPMHRDLIQRYQSVSSIVPSEKLKGRITSENLSTKLITLKNGDIFDTDKKTYDV